MSKALVLSLALAAPVPLPLPLPVRYADPASVDSLLDRSDLGALAPPSFRSRMRLTAGDKPPLEVEIWRKGDAKTLVRLLGPKEEGKYLLRLGKDLWFLAPGTRKPVRLDPSYRLRGSATLDDVLGLHYARDYRVASSTEAEPGIVTLELAARLPGATYPSIRYVVRRAGARPLRAEYRLPSGKVATVVEFAAWSEGRRPYVSRLMVQDALHGGAVTAVDVLELEERPVPDDLFALDDRSGRQRLETSPPAR
jgi:hypothetical protein